MKKLILTREEILKIENETEEKYGIKRIILMENAGREVFNCVKRELKSVKNKKILVFCGKGNNGGDGFVSARYFFNNGAIVKVYYTGKPEEFSDISFTNFDILNKMKVDIFSIDNLKLKEIEIKKGDIVIDGLLGIGLKGEIKGKLREIIEYINENASYIVSIDIPSGLDCDTGEVHGVAIKSNLTVSLGFLKRGFFINKGPQYTGKIKLGDIGFPKYYYE